MQTDMPAAISKIVPRCPLCDGKEFIAPRGYGSERCKRCGARNRTRTVYLLLTEVCRIDAASRVLHFAPEPVMAPLIKDICGDNYFPHDLDNGRYNFDFPVAHCNLCKDIDILFEKNSYDVVIHNHVVEHLPCNYTIVLQKLHALLKPGGRHIFSFPVNKSGRYRSDLSPALSERERHVRFGQKDHLRRFAREDFESTIGMIFDLDLTYSLTAFLPEEKLLSANIPPPRWTLEMGPVFVVEKTE